MSKEIFAVHADGLQEGVRLGFKEGIEAAAEWLENEEGYGWYNRFL